MRGAGGAGVHGAGVHDGGVRGGGGALGSDPLSSTLLDALSLTCWLTLLSALVAFRRDKLHTTLTALDLCQGEMCEGCEMCEV